MEAGLSPKLAEKAVFLERLPLVFAPINSALLLADKLLHRNGYSVSDNTANMVRIEGSVTAVACKVR